jgi:hypothetical protein
MVMRLTDPQFMKIMFAARLETLRGGRPLQSKPRVPRAN